MTEADRAWLRTVTSLEQKLHARPITFDPLRAAEARTDLRLVTGSKSLWDRSEWDLIEARKQALTDAGHDWFLTGPLAIEQLIAEGRLVERRRTRRKRTLALVVAGGPDAA